MLAVAGRDNKVLEGIMLMVSVKGRVSVVSRLGRVFRGGGMMFGGRWMVDGRAKWPSHSGQCVTMFIARKQSVHVDARRRCITNVAQGWRLEAGLRRVPLMDDTENRYLNAVTCKAV